MKVKKIAACLGAGALCVATGGLAAPAIGAAIGTSVLGLSGAAATSAGLAALGGGSLAAGGLGMAGGAAVVQAVAGGVGVIGAGAAVKAKETLDIRKEEANQAEQMAMKEQAKELEKFIFTLIDSLDMEDFVSLKDELRSHIYGFSRTDMTKDGISEKIKSYFDSTVKREEKTYYELLEDYLNNLDIIVRDRILFPKKTKKGEDEDPKCRAFRYYERAVLYKETMYGENLIDYSRIMFCLYQEIIKNGYNEITNFNFSADSLDLNQIVFGMKREEEKQGKIIKNKQKSNLFAPWNPYSSDACTFILAIICLKKISSDNKEAE